MGSRGAFDPDFGPTGGIPEDKREYSCIGMLGRIKIIQCDTKVNNPTTTYSNTANTTYYSSNKSTARIEHIYYFKNHKLYKSVDFKQNEIPHAHYWNSQQVGRKRHSKKNIHALSDRDKRLMTKALAYNNALKDKYGK